MFLEVKDSEWSTAHIARHDVTIAEVREAILERPYYQRAGRSGSLLCYGRTYAGRFLLVVAVEDSPGTAFIITARDMTRAEKKSFQREAR
ncbi:hypothetical protein GCM10029976_060560 [Kribbella albertanoniae]|uniref:BrnT family toxin n=1 Tax=Kribbella albertanoniae TaxID=1266829 RepID=A0A4R4Q3I6_9ACTN|nr:BrnT family toxin [Kribbella albertanoniae]TDC29597.1 BrnT family toxin [Kribbella albertanoniae]